MLSMVLLCTELPAAPADGEALELACEEPPVDEALVEAMELPMELPIECVEVDFPVDFDEAIEESTDFPAKSVSPPNTVLLAESLLATFFVFLFFFHTGQPKRL